MPGLGCLRPECCLGPLGRLLGNPRVAGCDRLAYCEVLADAGERLAPAGVGDGIVGLSMGDHSLAGAIDQARPVAVGLNRETVRQLGKGDAQASGDPLAGRRLGPLGQLRAHATASRRPSQTGGSSEHRICGEAESLGASANRLECCVSVGGAAALAVEGGEDCGQLRLGEVVILGSSGATATVAVLQARVPATLVAQGGAGAGGPTRRARLVDRARTAALVFRLARAGRDAWLQWPARIAATLAAELGVEAHAMQTVLERSLREQLDELAEPRLDLR